MISQAGLRCVALAALLLNGCQQPAPPAAVTAPAVMNGIGYLVLNAPISTSTRDLFIADADKLRDAGAMEIHLGINSPGGDVNAAQAIVDYMARMHGRYGMAFKAYNIGMVASAATYVFLSAQDRYSAANGAFLFHAAGVVSSGPINAANLRDQAERLDAYERTMRATLKARTRLTESEAQTYVRRTVVLNADDARRDGVVDAIAPYSMPPGVGAWVIAVKPPARAPARPAPVANPTNG